MPSRSTEYVDSRLKHTSSILTNHSTSTIYRKQGSRRETLIHGPALAAASTAMMRAHERARYSPPAVSGRASRTGESSGTHHFQSPSLRSTQSTRSLRRSNASDTLSSDVPPVPKIPLEYLKPPSPGHSRGCSAWTDSIMSGPISLSPAKGLRRAKSMFSIRSRSSKSADFETLKSKKDAMLGTFDTKYLSRRTLKRSQPLMRAKSHHKLQVSSCSYDSEIAVQLAREKFLEGYKQQEKDLCLQRNDSCPSRRDAKPLRRSIRSSTSVTESTRVSMDAPTCLNDSFIGKGYSESKARKLSTTIKKGLRRILRLSSSGETKSPTRNRSHNYFHLGEYLHGSTPEPHSNLCPCPEDAYRQHTHQHLIGKNRDFLEAAREKDEGIELTCDSTSRVTSWTDSTINTSRVRPIGGRSQQLSIIEEQGDSQNRVASGEASYDDGFSVFRHPPPAKYQGNQHVDSQEVYSALVRQIDHSRSGDDYDGDKTPTQQFGNRSHRNAFDFGSRPSLDAQASLSEGLSANVPSSLLKPSQRSMRSIYLGEAINCTPQQMADLNEGVSRRSSTKTLRDSRRHGFFSSRPATRSLMSSSALSSHDQRPVKPTTSDEDTGSIIVTRPQQNCEQSPSVYSRAASETSPEASRHSEFEKLQTPNETGTAIILANERIHYPRKSRNAADFLSKHWPGKGSAEWRSWVSSQMDTITINEPKPYLDAPVLPRGTSQHYRENAQFDDDVFTDANSSPDAKTVSPVASKNQNSSDRDRRTEFKNMVQSAFSRPLRLSPPGTRTVSQTSVWRPSVVHNSVQTSPSVASTSSPIHKRTSSMRLLVTPSKTSPGSLLADKQNKFSLSPSILSGPQHSKSAFLNRPRLGTGARQGRRETGVNDENVPARKPAIGTATDSDGTGDGSPGIYRSSPSSKRMVDLFLSERRRQMNESEETAAESAFI
ncbi:hypothetical protein KEM56_003891 [Ascosphaera pollenicola]|nr:hypothetical protein KEM56_003891 [Ascosphaera pollenicola]